MSGWPAAVTELEALARAARRLAEEGTEIPAGLGDPDVPPTQPGDPETADRVRRLAFDLAETIEAVAVARERVGSELDQLTRAREGALGYIRAGGG